MNTHLLINRIKYSPALYGCYYYLGTLVVNLLKLFVRCHSRRIVFVSFGGRKYDDSPKAIYEEILKDSRFDSCELIWAFHDPGNFEIPRGRKIKTDTLEYFFTLLSSRMWVTNSSVERGLHFKGRRTFYLNTWHGTPLKKMGSDIPNINTSFRGKGKKNLTDTMLAQSHYEAEIFSRVFSIAPEKFSVIGLPRNDNLISGNNAINIERIKKSMGMPTNKKVILYAPTFREYEKDEHRNCIMTPPLDLKKWKTLLGEEYVFLLRAHYEVIKVMNVQEDSFTWDVSNYPNLNELMLVSDILISDYSSIFFDYSLLGRPMLPYCYDYDIYSAKRGMYFDIREELDYYGKIESDLISEILKMDVTHRSGIAFRFREKYIESAGTATKSAVEIINSVLAV